ncbi:hypothetical protein QO009_003045 [Brevibacillus aydinogluensis]|jgi:hypothetical protein|uniref:hypothetical protein n=1 Tax=Brevibacillus aydinogluensis TaxID=927786 RepID=UPI002892DA2A|nr:hypothetical protein [Brevibacillus aydinogluensis]MDT3417150.1 hypothetical protein [Brevibacillus aydinogluensis]
MVKVKAVWRKIAIFLWLLLNAAGAYFSFQIPYPTDLPIWIIGANLILLGIGYLMGWMGVSLVLSTFYSVIGWVGAKSFSMWGYTKLVAYPMYLMAGVITLILLIFRRRFVKEAPEPWVTTIFPKKRREINALDFVIGDEVIDCEYPNSQSS